MTTDLQNLGDLIRNLSFSDKKQALSMLAAELATEKESDFTVPVMRDGQQFKYGLFRIPVGKIEVLDLKPGDPLYERCRLADDPRNCSPLETLLDEIPDD